VFEIPQSRTRRLNFNVLFGADVLIELDSFANVAQVEGTYRAKSRACKHQSSEKEIVTPSLAN